MTLAIFRARPSAPIGNHRAPHGLRAIALSPVGDAARQPGRSPTSTSAYPATVSTVPKLTRSPAQVSQAVPSARGVQRHEAPEFSGFWVPLKVIDDADGD